MKVCGWSFLAAAGRSKSVPNWESFMRKFQDGPIDAFIMGAIPLRAGPRRRSWRARPDALRCFLRFHRAANGRLGAARIEQGGWNDTERPGCIDHWSFKRYRPGDGGSHGA